MSSWAFCTVCGDRKSIHPRKQDRSTYTCRACRSKQLDASATCIDCGSAKGRNGNPRCIPCGQRIAAEKGATLTNWKVCPACQSTFKKTRSGKGEGPYCSHDCYVIARYGARREPRFPQSRIAVKPCGWCGDLFTAHPVNVAYCSDYCRLSKMIGKAAKRVTDLYSEAARLGFGGQNWRKLLVAALRERDGDLCCLCWSPIDFTVKSGPRGSRNGHSIEHLVPRSESQDDTWANLALSHWGCNSDRKTQPIDVLWRAS